MRDIIGLHPSEKYTTLILMLSYDTLPDALDESFMISAYIIRESLINLQSM